MYELTAAGDTVPHISVPAQTTVFVSFVKHQHRETEERKGEREGERERVCVCVRLSQDYTYASPFASYRRKEKDLIFERQAISRTGLCTSMFG